MSADDVAIRATGLSKRYALGAREPYRLLSQSIGRAIRRGVARGSDEKRFVWALDDISFEIRHGEVFGVIGPNGAGKSTLLKILSRITEPTRGSAELHGRVGSLLEIGTGFHGEFTGRENVYMNGAILGMSRGEIARKYDDIVEFAGTGRFMDTPLKFYSSGMSVRLGFAVAAFLEPEILIVDEVLTVGDLSFQERCLGKIRDVASDGRTVMFVSHNMSAILSICQKSLLLTGGKLAYMGPSADAVARYIDASKLSGSSWLDEPRTRPGTGAVRVRSLRLEDDAGELCVAPAAGQGVRFVLDYEAEDDADLRELVVNIVVSEHGGRGLLSFMSQVAGPSMLDAPQRGRVTCTVPALPLMPGHYNVQYSCLLGSVLADKIHQAGSLIVSEGDFYGTGKLPPQAEYYGPVLVHQAWSVEPQAP